MKLVLLVATVVFVAQAGLTFNEDKVKCYTEASDKVTNEPDADLKDKISFILTGVQGLADNMNSMTDAQMQRMVSLYFSEVCEPLKNFFQ